MARKSVAMAVALSLAGDAAAFSTFTSCLSQLPSVKHGVSTIGRAGGVAAGSLSLTMSKKSIIVDEASTLKSQNFPLAPEELISRAQTFLKSRGGFGADPDLMADDFQFMGPVVSWKSRKMAC